MIHWNSWLTIILIWGSRLLLRSKSFYCQERIRIRLRDIKWGWREPSHHSLVETQQRKVDNGFAVGDAHLSNLANKNGFWLAVQGLYFSQLASRSNLKWNSISEWASPGNTHTKIHPVSCRQHSFSATQLGTEIAVPAVPIWLSAFSPQFSSVIRKQTNKFHISTLLQDSWRITV